jgi:hypothetical protein
MTRSKDKGTSAESMVVRYLQSTYWVNAERRALSGGLDKGDITGTPGLAWEVKAAKTLCVPAWLRETETERINAKADYATLVIKPAGIGGTRVGQFYALMGRGFFGDMMQEEPFGAWDRTYSFEATIRRTGFPAALDNVAFNLRAHGMKFGWVYYPEFILTDLDTMCALLNRAGYGSNDKREKDQA